LHRKGIYPPINVLLGLSRLMNNGIGKGKTREDHKEVYEQLYTAYAEGNDLRGLVAIVGREALSGRDRRFLDFADAFENRFVRQGLYEDRSIDDSLELAWELFSMIPEHDLVKLKPETKKKYYKGFKGEE